MSRIGGAWAAGQECGAWVGIEGPWGQIPPPSLPTGGADPDLTPLAWKMTRGGIGGALGGETRVGRNDGAKLSPVSSILRGGNTGVRAPMPSPPLLCSPPKMGAETQVSGPEHSSVVEKGLYWYKRCIKICRRTQVAWGQGQIKGGAPGCSRADSGCGSARGPGSWGRKKRGGQRGN